MTFLIGCAKQATAWGYSPNYFSYIVLMGAGRPATAAATAVIALTLPKHSPVQ